MNDLGDRMPSALMDEMQVLLDGHQLCMPFEQLFQRQLSEPICLRLADADFTDPSRVAELADELWLSMDPKAALQYTELLLGYANTEWWLYHNRLGGKSR